MPHHLGPRAVALELVEVAHAGLLGLDSSSWAPGSGSRTCRGCPRRPRITFHIYFCLGTRIARILFDFYRLVQNGDQPFDIFGFDENFFHCLKKLTLGCFDIFGFDEKFFHCLKKNRTLGFLTSFDLT